MATVNEETFGERGPEAMTFCEEASSKLEADSGLVSTQYPWNVAVLQVRWWPGLEIVLGVARDTGYYHG
jgi:hypothetical protein